MPTHYQGDPTIALALDTFTKLSRAFNTFESHLWRHNVIGNLTPSQFGVLEILHHLGPQCQGTISAKLLKSSGNVTLVLDNLEKAGLIVRTRDTEDRRKVNLSLTDQGEELIARVFPLQAEVIAQEMSILTPEEQQRLGELCKKLGKGIDESSSSKTD